MIVTKGNAHVFGDNINTDYIISSRRKRDTLDLSVLKKYLMEDIAPGFGDKVNKGDIIVAGSNFGCGSAMEVASLVIQAAGVNVVIAKSFARTFFRNGFNGGLLLIEADTSIISGGDILEISLSEEETRIKNYTTKTNLVVEPFDGLLKEIFQAGGLVSYLRKHKGWGY